jgi:hypothetical protein
MPPQRKGSDVSTSSGGSTRQRMLANAPARRSSKGDGENQRNEGLKNSQERLSPEVPRTSNSRRNSVDNSGRKLPTVIKTLETKTHPELVSIAKKMMAEINIKNRIISDMHNNEKWMAAEIAASKSSFKDETFASELEKALKSSKTSETDKTMMRTLLKFRDELTKAKDSIAEVLLI